MTPLIVIAPCGCMCELTGKSVRWCDATRTHTSEDVAAFTVWINALRSNPALAYSLARAGYAMAMMGVGRE